VDGRPLDVPVHPYQQVHVALVAGELSAAYFGDRAGRLPSHVFVSDDARAPFKSLGTTGYSTALSSRLYKFFSADHELTEADIGAAFTKVSDVLRFTWRGAYPVIAPGIKHVPFRLHPLLYYACAFETAAGAIEVEAVGGWNTAELLIQDLA
jgi:hypothetical protein